MTAVEFVQKWRAFLLQERDGESRRSGTHNCLALPGEAARRFIAEAQEVLAHEKPRPLGRG